ncbi:M13 family metallopeptidase [Flavobacterium columnare]|uniref:M13 family metallopeptidase n=2 Tax=Flavobacterium columnare TaxID=996 RepID=UPI0007F983CE|nr:M13 family metallopeptidase [Flavobacterium columnare]ANO48174.1 metalloendopeptidase [Flavobacterium columnare]APT21260.1 metalloendopeptidase [Flavobacterium columnare]QOG88619.1 M13 family metallopeptidase [Flavobacterium columnare]QOG91278.1 M13 family metallopeptidase [Flavobacterium columnare]QOG93941.1 M13 family metallopeptidase [Flavobacterium columnare]
MKINKLFILLLTIIVFAESCKKEMLDPNNPDVLVANRDTTIDLSNDFFEYANGGWFKKNPIPASERSNGIFRTIQDTINSQIKQICEKSAKENAEIRSNKQKIGDFYLSGMDTLTINKLGLSPLQKELAKIENIKNLSSLTKHLAYMHTIGAAPGFDFYIAQDDKNSAKYALFFTQGGLGMGNREYYFNADKEAVRIRGAYFSYLEQIFKLIGTEKTAFDDAQTVIKLETELAKHSRKLEDLRDPIANYNKMTLTKFKELTPNLMWDTMLEQLKIKKADSLIVGQPEFYKALNNTIKKHTIEDWKVYLKWNLVNSYAVYLSDNFEKKHFNFYSTVMSGVKEQKPRWKRVVEKTDEALGELIGQVYVEEYLPKGTKEKLLEIGNAIKTVYADRIKKLDWMSPETKKKALFKLSKIVMKVGYPDKWKDLSSILIDKHHYLANIMAVNQWNYNEMASKYGKSVDRTEWGMYPQTYNAYYNPSNNEICVPACNIIVPGFKGRMPDDAVLYGIIGGSTFGHEITHGFDDQGSQYDEKGNLNNWWTTEDLKKFKAKTKAIVKQYNSYQALPGKFVNGQATQGENIADLGGVIMGYEAFKKTEQFKKKQKIAGLKPNERFFLAYGYAWMVNVKTEALAQQLIEDVHAPARYRINGPLSNIDVFYETFKIKEGTKMFIPKNDRVIIW